MQITTLDQNIICGATQLSSFDTWDNSNRLNPNHTRDSIESLQKRATSACDTALKCIALERNEVTNKRGIRFLPTCMEKCLGGLMYGNLIDSNGGLSTNRNMKRLVESVVADLKPHICRQTQFNWDIQLVSSKQMNAMALPGGKIVICEGIIDAMVEFVQGKIEDNQNYTQEDAQKDVRAMLALVLGHEIAHSDIGHGRKSIERMILVYILVGVFLAIAKALALGSQNKARTAEERAKANAIAKLIDALSMLFFKFGMFFYQLAMSRSAEKEADEMSMKRYMYQAGYDYRRGAMLFDMFAAKSGTEHATSGCLKKMLECLGTHPLASTRAKLAEKHADLLDKAAQSTSPAA